MSHTFPASKDGTCLFCGTQIAVGDLIGRVGGRMYGCAACVAAPHLDGLGEPTILARREGPCSMCGELVRPGDRLSLAPYGQTLCVSCGSDREKLMARYCPVRRKGSG